MIPSLRHTRPMRTQRFPKSGTIRGWKMPALFLPLLALNCISLAGTGQTLSEEARSALFIHPLWLDRFIGPASPGSASLKTVESVPVQTFNRRGAAEGAAPFVWADRPSEGSSWEGYIGYREAARWTDSVTGFALAVLEIGINTGGTGVFGALALMERSDGDLYLQRWIIYGGDRCNDGRPRLIKLSGHEVFYALSATPFRLLNPVDPNDGRMIDLLLARPPENASTGRAAKAGPDTLFGWRPYSDLANSAISCAGEIVFRRDTRTGEAEIVGVTVDLQSFLAETQGSIQACVNDWLRELTLDLGTAENGWIPLEKWMVGLPALGEQCAPES